MPISMTANVADRMLRWPTVNVSQPSAQAVPTSRVTTSARGRRCRDRRRGTAGRRRAMASHDAHCVSRWAAAISSVSSTGIPVRPNSRSGNEARASATMPRIASTLLRAAVNEPCSFIGRTSRKARPPEPLKKYCGSARRSSWPAGRVLIRLPQGLLYRFGVVEVGAGRPRHRLELRDRTAPRRR